MKAIYTLLILLIPFVGFGQIPSYVAQNGLIGWWPFNQNSLDESGNNLHLNPQGDAMLVEDRFFEENSAYRFTTNDNNSKLLFNDNAFSIINNLSSGSISIWVKINEHNISGHYFQNDNFFSGLRSRFFTRDSAEQSIYRVPPARARQVSAVRVPLKKTSGYPVSRQLLMSSPPLGVSRVLSGEEFSNGSISLDHSYFQQP